jgi:hypothetical protein
VSPTLRVCHQPFGDIGCVVADLRVPWVERKAITEQEITALTEANALPRRIPSNLIVVVPVEQAFLGAREWQAVWHGVDRRKLADCVQFTVPAYVNGAALVYAQRVSRGHAYGWFLRLEGHGGLWRVVAKTLVWDSFPSA